MPTQSPTQQLELKTSDRPERPVYEPPSVTSYTDEQLLEALGPAQAGPAYGTQPG